MFLELAGCLDVTQFKVMRDYIIATSIHYPKFCSPPKTLLSRLTSALTHLIWLTKLSG